MAGSRTGSWTQKCSRARESARVHVSPDYDREQPCAQAEREGHFRPAVVFLKLHSQAIAHLSRRKAPHDPSRNAEGRLRAPRTGVFRIVERRPRGCGATVADLSRSEPTLRGNASAKSFPHQRAYSRANGEGGLTGLPQARANLRMNAKPLYVMPSCQSSVWPAAPKCYANCQLRGRICKSGFRICWMSARDFWIPRALSGLRRLDFARSGAPQRVAWSRAHEQGERSRFGSRS